MKTINCLVFLFSCTSFIFSQEENPALNFTDSTANYYLVVTQSNGKKQSFDVSIHTESDNTTYKLKAVGISIAKLMEKLNRSSHTRTIADDQLANTYLDISFKSERIQEPRRYLSDMLCERLGIEAKKIDTLVEVYEFTLLDIAKLQKHATVFSGSATINERKKETVFKAVELDVVAAKIERKYEALTVNGDIGGLYDIELPYFDRLEEVRKFMAEEYGVELKKAMRTLHFLRVKKL